MSEPNPQHTTRLISHFADRNRQQQSAGWSELWESDQSDLWDRGQPSRALIDWLESKPEELPRVQNGRRLRALVPGCGKGYDVVMLALHGFDVYGLEVSQTGGQAAEDYAATELAGPSGYNFGSPDTRPNEGVGNVKIVVGDFFTRDWETECGGTGFDLVYDYTFLCALLPDMRQSWARRMQDLLAPRALLVCLEFPMYKALDAPGPPWGLNGVYWNLLSEGGNGIINEKVEETGSGKGPFQRVAYFKPSRSYENGKGTDMMSVWILK
ncbi:hypothetical protein NM208_g6271 [Fusarium decemcellulare]|uniref:Uncharacterized protein n=1 Tax=Fusarium decemcellulare TaxID=57161 RepID=A0ACC1SDK2_9HYPO|nr:hypothetical protein NM208_g6271 [Fusarium decemcellulare]